MATEANLCADAQDKYFEYRKAMYANINQIGTQAGLLSIASQVEGLDSDQIEQCLYDKTYSALLKKGQSVAARQGVNSTPTFFINGTKVEGNQPYDTFKKLIDKEIARSESSN